MGGFFHIEYTDGRYTEIRFKTAAMAKRAYEMYAKEPECTAKAYGWDTEYEQPTLSQQIRAKKVRHVETPRHSWEDLSRAYITGDFEDI